MNEIALQIIGIFIGPLTDIIYFTLFFIYSKNIKEKRILLFILIAITYIVCVMISQYNVFCYIIFYFLCLGILKLLYKEKAQWADIFLTLFMSLYLSLVSCLAFNFVKEDYSNYYAIAAVDKILLFLLFIFKDKFNIIYKKYCRLWNRNDNEKRFIKSITLRIISLISLNCFLFVSNLMFLYMKTL